jgi:hypothetical protein
MAVDARTESVEVVAVGAGRKGLAFAEVFLLSLWLGSMIFFSFAVAPSAFAVLPTRELAGVMVTSTIAKVEVLGLVIGPFLILMNLASHRGEPSSPKIKCSKIILLIVMVAAAALSHFWILPRMVSLRAAMGGHIDDLPLNDALRVQFNGLHHYSVTLMGIAMIAGVVVLFLTVRSWIKR